MNFRLSSWPLTLKGQIKVKIKKKAQLIFLHVQSKITLRTPGTLFKKIHFLLHLKGQIKVTISENSIYTK